MAYEHQSEDTRREIQEDESRDQARSRQDEAHERGVEAVARALGQAA